MSREVSKQRKVNELNLHASPAMVLIQQFQRELADAALIGSARSLTLKTVQFTLH